MKGRKEGQNVQGWRASFERAWRTWNAAHTGVSRTLAFRALDEAWSGGSATGRVAIDVFGEESGKQFHFWVTAWDVPRAEIEGELRGLFESLADLGVASVALQLRSGEELKEPIALVGELPRTFVTRESLVTGPAPAASDPRLRMEIRFHGMKHPGFFLDQAPLRKWLVAHARGMRVLNTFSYTGSLGLACAVGGAREVTQVDLSKATLEWAKANAALNGVADKAHRTFAADALYWLAGARRRIEKGDAPYDLVILDPPSFSRSKEGVFSTQKDLIRLHLEALDVLAPDGWLVTSINSEAISEKRFAFEVNDAARTWGGRLERVQGIEAPAPFAPGFLKGAIYQWKPRGARRRPASEDSTEIEYPEAKVPRGAAAPSRSGGSKKASTNAGRAERSPAKGGRTSDRPRSGGPRPRTGHGSGASGRSQARTRKR